MPGGDNSGPEGRGPMSGRGLGYCAGYGEPGWTADAPGMGRGRGYGRGRGFGRGWGRGFGRGRAHGYGRGYGWGRRRWYDYDDPYYGEPPVDRAAAPDDEKGFLEAELEDLKARMEQIKKRLEALK